VTGENKDEVSPLGEYMPSVFHRCDDISVLLSSMVFVDNTGQKKLPWQGCFKTSLAKIRYGTRALVSRHPVCPSIPFRYYCGFLRLYSLLVRSWLLPCRFVANFFSLEHVAKVKWYPCGGHRAGVGWGRGTRRLQSAIWPRGNDQPSFN
jgi:hypothetical protein